MTRARTAAFYGLLALGVMPAAEAVSQQPQPVQAPVTAPNAAQPGNYTDGGPPADAGSRPHFTFGGALPSFTFEIGKWGTTSSTPHADTGSYRDKAEDPACNMPSSHCWNEDRQ
jgi:hypothetical protein